jgi:hypothetical protein
MPVEAYALVTTFACVSLVTGAIAAWVLGPRRWLAIIVPTAAAFLALYTIGHRLGLVAGPQVELFGFQVSIVLDVGVAIIAAFVGAAAQRAVLGVWARRRRGEVSARP